MRVVHFQATPHTSSKTDTGDGSELGLVSFPDPPPPLCSHFEVGGRRKGLVVTLPYHFHTSARNQARTIRLQNAIVTQYNVQAVGSTL